MNENTQIITVRRDTKIVWSYLVKQYALRLFLKASAGFDGLQAYAASKSLPKLSERL